MPRIALIHATALAVDPIREAFARLWPEAHITHLLDDSLSVDLAAAGRLDDAMMARFETLGRYSHRAGADAVLFTCSAFGPAIEAVARILPIPVLKPNEAMLEEALGLGDRLAVIATFLPTLASMEAEFRELAAASNRSVTLSNIHVPRAMDLLAQGDGTTHDALIADSLSTTANSQAILLSQFSMARAAELARRATTLPVLTSPDSAVRKLRALLD
jgi:Asp/Glu/hydantoin racemase